MKKIIVPCDFSPVSLEAYKFALNLAARVRGEVTLVFAIDLPVFVGGFDMQPYIYDPTLALGLKEWAEKKFHELAKLNTHRIPLRLRTEQTDVRNAVVNAIKSTMADLVVMGTHGAQGVNEFMFGSNAEKIVRFSPVPVIAVRKDIPLSSVNKILFPTDLSTDHPQMVERLKKLQEFFGASLDIVWVNTPDNFRTDKEIQGMMAEFVKVNRLKNYSLYICNDIHEEGGIAGYAAKSKADMIAMATHGRRGLSHLLAGSLAEKVINHIECPVWTYSLHNEARVKKLQTKKSKTKVL